MNIDPAALRKRRDALQAKGFGGGRKNKVTYYDMKRPGTYTFFLCPPTAAMDSFPSLPTLTHFILVGTGKKAYACLDPELPTFSGVWGENLQRAIEARNAAVTKDGKPEWAMQLPDPLECPDCGDIDLTEKSLGFVIPWGYRGVGEGPDQMIPTTMAQRSKVIPWQASPVTMDKVMNLLLRDGVKIGNPEAAIFVTVTREGTGFTDTKYDVGFDIDSMQSPQPLPPFSMKALEQMQPGGACDPFAILAGSLRPLKQILEWQGKGPAKTETPPPGDDAGANEAPPCFKDGTTYDGNNAYCQECPFSGECAPAATAKAPPATEPEPPPAKPKAETKATPPPPKDEAPPADGDAKAAFMAAFNSPE
ncbi:MAG: hypothetical protein GY871_04180 [Actinomycetales bacterium]|nr:hypothetical protein [Actinomycetales bacterium]